MRVTLTVITGPNKGQDFGFAKHDTFLVGRSKHAHFRLPVKDKYFSRMHFMMEVNPPQCRLIDLGSHNGTFVNGDKVLMADLKDGDQIRAGHTTFRVAMIRDPGDEATSESSVEQSALSLPTAPQAPPGLASRIADYHLIKVLGAGTMGHTFVARRGKDGMLFALKTIQPIGGTLAQAHQFLKEAQVLGGLQHPHIVRLHELGEEKGTLYFVSDYITGTDAAALMAEGRPLDVPRVIQLGSDVLIALEHAHAKGRIHRDIKPANVLVEQRGSKEKALLGDFGLSHLYQQSQLSGLTMMKPGAASFYPPEYLTRYDEANPAGDQYSVAATLYYLLTAKPPLDVPLDVQSQFSALLEQRAEPILNRRPGLPKGLAAAIDTALDPDPKKRFADVTGFRKALQIDN